MNILVRKANVADAEAIHALIEKLAPLFLQQIDFKQLSSFKLEKYKEYLQCSQYHFYVASEFQQIVGVIALRDPAHLYHLYVAETHHRKGIAKKLWNHVLQYQKSTHPDHKVMTVNASLNAVETYCKLGFERLADGHEKMNGLQFVPMKYMIP